MAVSSPAAPENGSLTDPGMVGFEWLLLLAVGFFGGAAHAMPEFMYVGGLIGPFDVLVLTLLGRWMIVPPRTVDAAERALYLPFVFFAFFAYIGDLVGALTFGANTYAGTVAPVRYLLYPTLFFTLRPFLRASADLRTLFTAYILGVLAVCTSDLLRSTNDVFGVPQLFNANVLGNFISYAMIVLGFSFMPRGAVFKTGALLALFAFAMCTFSKATWLLAILGIYLNSLSFRRLSLPFLFLVSVATLVYAFTDWGDVFEIAYKTVELKLNVSRGDDDSGGSTFMRLGFFLSSMQSLIDYPFGIGLKNFMAYHHTHMRALGPLFTEAESPHTALGFVAVQAGWIGVALFALIFVRVVATLRELYQSSKWTTAPILLGMTLVSVLFQIEFITQPFIYLVLAAGLASKRLSRAPLESSSRSHVVGGVVA